MRASRDPTITAFFEEHLEGSSHPSFILFSRNGALEAHQSIVALSLYLSGDLSGHVVARGSWFSREQECAHTVQLSLAGEVKK
jgi:hypothetical protein